MLGGEIHGIMSELNKGAKTKMNLRVISFV
jgi:hypothetical protein